MIMAQGGLRRPIFGKKIVKRPAEQTQIIDLEAANTALARPVRLDPEFRFIKRPRIVRNFLHSFEVGTKGKRITGTTTIVRNPAEFDGLFKKGEKILYIHVDLRGKDQKLKEKEGVRLIRSFKKLGVASRNPEAQESKMLKELKAQGYVGLCGDTPTTTIANLFVLAKGKNLGNEPIPSVVKLREKARYLLNMFFRGYPKKYLKRPLQRVVFRF